MCTYSGLQDVGTSELRRSTAVVYRSDHRARSTGRFCRAGQLATVDTCCMCVGHARRWLGGLEFLLVKDKG